MEAEGSFSVAKRGDRVIVITQKDISLLHHIAKNLGFGRINPKQNSNCGGLVFGTQEQVHLILLLLNGNLVLGRRVYDRVGLLRFLNEWNSKRQNPFIRPILSLVTPTLNDNWLLGFIDGEGSFAISVTSEPLKFIACFSVSQSYICSLELWCLLHLLLGKAGNICEHNKPNSWTLHLQGQDLDVLVSYLTPLFDRKLRASWFGDFDTLKQISFHRWLVVKHRGLVLMEHKSLAKLPALRVDASMVNVFDIEYVERYAKYVDY